MKKGRPSSPPEGDSLIARIRAKHGLEKPELAKILCVSVTTIARWERGKMPISEKSKPKVEALLNTKPLKGNILDVEPLEACGAAIPTEVQRRIVVEKKSPIRAWREHKKLTQKMVADRLYMGRSTYSLYENGRENLGTDILEHFANVFEISLDDLIASYRLPLASCGTPA